VSSITLIEHKIVILYIFSLNVFFAMFAQFDAKYFKLIKRIIFSINTIVYKANISFSNTILVIFA